METTQARGGISSTLVLAVVALLVAVAALALTAMSGGADDESLAADLAGAVDADAYHAVTLTSGTVYYGKLSSEGGALLLDDVYYLGGATEENPSGSLVKRGAEIYAPAGPMLLNADLVLQIDEIGADSVIARGIERIASGEGGGGDDTADETTTTEAPATTTTAAPTTTTGG